MNIRVKPETEAWLVAQVAEGHFATIDEAVEALVLQHQVLALDVDEDDHLWAKPEIEAALASLDRGESSPLRDVAERLRSRIASLS